MDIQVLNEIANQARQTSLSQVKASIAANAQLKALKGSAVPVPGDPSAPPLEDSPDQIQAPVAPDISPVARAASSYSSVVGGELNSDELQAIQDLAGRVRTVVSEFLSQPGLEQAENAAAAVASNPEAVQKLTSSVEQAVLATLDLPTVEGEVIVNAVPTPASTDVPANIPVLENPISIERITKGAELNNPVVAANPAVVDSRASETTGVENPVTVEEVPETPRGDFRVTAPIPALQNLPESETIQVETLEGQPEVVVVPQQEPVSRPEAVATNRQEVPVPAPSPNVPNAQDGEVVVAPQQGPPVSRPEIAATDRQVAPVTVARPAPQNTQANENVQVETPTSRGEGVILPQQEPVVVTETARTSPQTGPVTAPSSASPNVQASQKTQVETSGIVARPELQNAPAQNTEVGNPVALPVSPVDQGKRSEVITAETVPPEASAVPPAEVGNQAAPSPFNPKPASTPPQSGLSPANDLFAQEGATVNPENIRDANELVGSVVSSEFAAEAKKIFSEPKMIRTVADLADFILERLQEIIAINQQQPQSSGETGIS